MRVGIAALAVAWMIASPRSAAADSKLSKELVLPSDRAQPSPRRKECCGYPLVEEHGFALRFYWLAMQDKYPHDHDEVDLYTPEGDFLGVFPHRFYRSLRMEGSGILSDGRVVNYAGRCKYGMGTCFEVLDWNEYPVGRGARRRALVPFKSIAVDPRLIPIGDPVYIPEFDGLRMPDGTVHDGCVRADDTGGGIKYRKMDFFVVSYGNFRTLLSRLWGVIWVTPHIEAPRCEYMRDR